MRRPELLWLLLLCRSLRHRPPLQRSLADPRSVEFACWLEASLEKEASVAGEAVDKNSNEGKAAAHLLQLQRLAHPPPSLCAPPRLRLHLLGHDALGFQLRLRSNLERTLMPSHDRRSSCEWPLRRARAMRNLRRQPLRMRLCLDPCWPCSLSC